MGCSPSKGMNTKGNSTKEDKKNQGTVEIEQPVSRKKTSLKFSLLKLQQEDSLMNLMNALFFGEKQNQSIDVCFQSLYCEVDDRHHYYIQRLLNVEMESLEKPFSGKMWVLHLGGKVVDWDYAVHTDMKIDLSSELPKLLWKYEKLGNITKEQLSIVHQISQTNNLSYLNRAEIDEKTTIKPKILIHNNQDVLRIAATETTMNEDKSSTDGSKNVDGIRYDSSPRRNNPKQVIKDNSQAIVEEDTVVNTEESNALGQKSTRNEKYLYPEKVPKNNSKNNRTHTTNSARNPHEQRMNTEEENRNIYAPVQTEAAAPLGDHFDTQEVNCVFEDAPDREGEKIVGEIDGNGAIVPSDLIPKQYGEKNVEANPLNASHFMSHYASIIKMSSNNIEGEIS